MCEAEHMLLGKHTDGEMSYTGTEPDWLNTEMRGKLSILGLNAELYKSLIDCAFDTNDDCRIFVGRPPARRGEVFDYR